MSNNWTVMINGTELWFGMTATNRSLVGSAINDSTRNNKMETAQGSIYIIQGIAILTIALPSLFAFACNKELRTSFNCYIILVLLADVVAFADTVLMAIHSFHGSPFLDKQACTIKLAASYLAGSFHLYASNLISINRLWALFFPIHYREHHSKKVVLILCCGVTLFSLVLVLPYVIMNMPFLQPSMSSCVIVPTGQPRYNIVRFACHQFGLYFPALSYPFLLLKQSRRFRTTQPYALQQIVSSITAGQRARRSAAASVREEDRIRLAEERSKRQRVNFLILTWSVICVTVFWVPFSVHQILCLITQTARVTAMTNWFYLWAVTVYCAEPWIYALTIPMLRAKLVHYRQTLFKV